MSSTTIERSIPRTHSTGKWSEPFYSRKSTNIAKNLQNFTTSREVVEALESAGSPDGVARLLKAWGISGERFDDDNCPLANVFKTLISNEDRFSYFVNKNPAKQGIPDWDNEDVEFPPNISEFIRQFDNGEYPDLEVIKKDTDESL